MRMPKQYVGPWMCGAKVRPAPECGMEHRAGNADFGITQAPDTETLKEWLHTAMTGHMHGSNWPVDVPADAWLPSNSHAVIWQGQKDTYYYQAGVTGGKRRVYDLMSAVADKPKKSVSAARTVLDNFLRLVDQAEKRGLTRLKERAKLSPKDAARLRRNVKISFTNWAQT